MAKLISILILSSLLFPIVENSISENRNNGRREVRIIAISIPSTRTPLELIRLFQEDAKLEAFFYDDLGSTQITVHNSSGMCVYHTVIEANVEEHTAIDLSLCLKGSYKITFTTDKNSFVGEFQL